MTKTSACVLLASLLLGMAFATQARAGVYSDTLGKCMVSSSSESDKQRLIEWIFAAIALNPAVAPYANIPAPKRDEIDKNMATLFERLLGESCTRETTDALKYEGQYALQMAFQLLGQVAGAQIFAAPEVAKGSEGFVRYLDLEKLQKTLGVEPGR